MTTNGNPGPRRGGTLAIWRFLIRDFFVRHVAFPLLAKVKVSHVDRVPASGPTVIILNHQSGVDPVVALGVVPFRAVIPMSKIENFRIPVLGFFMRRWGVFPIHREQIDRTALQTTIDMLKSNELVLMAPEGHRQPILTEAKDGFTYVAAKANAVVVPVGIDGGHDLIRNMKRLRRTPITVNVGQPFRFKTGGKERIPRAQLSQMTQEAMYQLAALLPESKRGFYSDLSKSTTETLEFV